MRMPKKTESIVTKEPQTVANDVDTAEVAEIVRNGEPINWIYWASRYDISPNQAARLTYCIDPIRWPDEKHAQGIWSDDLREKILKLTDWLSERRTSWTLAKLVDALGEQFAPYTMKQSIWMQLAVAEQRSEERKQKAGRYTLQEAAQLLGTEAGERVAVMLKKLMAAAEGGDLLVYAPGGNAKHEYGKGHAPCVRDFYEEAFWNDLNAWLEKYETRITWRFPDPKATSATVANRAEARQQGVPSSLILDKFRLGADWENKLRHKKGYSYLKPPVLAESGARGKGRNLWNPAQFAKMLMDRDGRKHNLTRMNTIIEHHFPDWIDEWYEISGLSDE